MNSISKMKSIFSPKLSAFSPHLPKPHAIYLASNASPLESFVRHNSACSSNNLSRKLTPFLSNSFVCSSQSRNLQMEASRPPSGEIHVIVGPMFAGKTTSLLRRMQLESSSGRHKFGLDAYDQLDVIGIDEAQFFEDLYDFCCEAADHDGKTVIVAGLDGNYLRRSFGSVLDIIPIADSITKLTARCEICGKRAFFTLRKIEETQVELIGGSEVYMPVCRQHYVSGQVAMETARYVLESQKVECGSHT